MLEKKNDKFQYTSQTIQEFNIKQIIQGFRGSKTMLQDGTSTSLPLDLASVEFLSCEPDQIFKKAKYGQKFGLIYISFELSHLVENVKPILKDGGRVIVEDCEYYLALSREQKVAYRENVEKLAMKSGLKLFKTPDLESTSKLLFVK